jgi:putative ABC transport system permease protein
VLLEGASLGVIGALLGIAAGYLLAAAALALLRRRPRRRLLPRRPAQGRVHPGGGLRVLRLGLGVALLGCAGAGLEAARARPAVALKAGNDEAALEAPVARIWPSLLCLGLAAIFAFAPPVFELPLFGYFAVALLLIGGIGLMPRLAAVAFRRLERAVLAPARSPVLALTLARLANAPGQASIALGGVLASFSLMVAMGIMVASFRVSVDDWMLHILPADLYVRSGGGNTARWRPASRRRSPRCPAACRKCSSCARGRCRSIRRGRM